MSFLGKYIQSRFKAIGYTFEGVWRLISKEESIQVQLILFLIACVLGYFLEFSTLDWLFQLLAFGLIFTTEALNTAIEEICNYIQPNRHAKIKEIKDIGAGAVLLSSLFAGAILLIIYLPKILG